MKIASYPIPANEAGRLKALYQYELLDTFSEKEYDFITKMASQICNTPASLITLIDENRQFVKSFFGFELRETPREISFCNYTILDPHNVNVVPDLRLDDRYNTNPLVTGEPNAVFYAGAPLVTPQGFVLGSICVLGAERKELTEEQKEALKALAQQTITTMELRKKNKDLKTAKEKLKKVNHKLNEYVKIVSHDMKTPLANITMLSKGFRRNFKEVLNEHSEAYIELIENSASGLIDFINDMFAKTKKKSHDIDENKKVDTLSILKKVITLVAPTEDIKINIKGSFPTMPIDEIALQQVFQNLITNAIKYNDKPKGIIEIIADSDHRYHYFHISDNGSGIASNDLNKIFNDQQTLDKTDRYGNKGTGIGLAKVKNIVESFGGNISVASELSKGTAFKVCIPLYDNLSVAM
ncbi:sensor histidine kinase [Ferruginibacter sp. SUN002]|uniref:sensor histidine kinase n=1 Tax=Ferruginibacter sp. SUN002 TaxID=2937789 RepID=UPI003D36B363